MKEESEKVDLKLNTQKTKIIASGPITSWQIDGGKVEIVTNFIFLDSRITIDGDCSHEIKTKQNKTLASSEKSFDKPTYHIKQQRHHFSDKGLYSYSFPSSHVNRCESWTIK